MWRCHCGETNLSSAAYCAECEAPKLTHEEKTREPRKRESNTRNVHVGFMGVGGERPTGRRSIATGPSRPLTETEIAAYYAGQKRRNIVMWLLYVAAGLAVVALLVWQVLREP